MSESNSSPKPTQSQQNDIQPCIIGCGFYVIKSKVNIPKITVKKKCKFSYKSVLNGVMKGGRSSKKQSYDQEALQKTGGGLFLKVDKI